MSVQTLKNTGLIFSQTQPKDTKNISKTLIDEYLNQSDWKVKENANMSYSLQGLRNHIVSEITKEYWLQIYPKHISDKYLNGDFHIHDAGELACYCCGWDLEELLRSGFTGVTGKISCLPAKHFDTALNQIVNFIYSLQGEAAGAMAFSNFDTLLAPFIYYDKLNYNQVKRQLQSFVFNLNIPTRVGFQTPFSNLTMDINPPQFLAEQNVIIGGLLKSKTYGDFQKEMDILNQAFAEIMLEGDGHGRVFTFPIPTYNITKNFDWSDHRYDKIWEMAGTYGIPYFANYVNSNMNPEDARSMCCRLRLDNRELRSRGGGLFGSNPLTGSIGVVTINLPRIGYLAQTEDELFEMLENLVNTASESLEIKRNIIEKLTEDGLYPYTAFYLQGIKARQKSFWANHFSTIGIVGMNEMLENFNGDKIYTQTGQKFALKIMDFLRDKIQTIQNETGNLYNLEATPAEGTSYRLAKLDQKYFPLMPTFEIQKTQKGQDVEYYYTNSTQLPVGFTEDVFEALELQDDLQTKYTGGTVLHAYLGEKICDTTIVKKLIQKITSQYRLPYFTLTPTFSICKNHKYLVGEQPICPICKSKTEVYSRVTGYIRPVDQWNNGKRQEFQDRVTFKF